MTTADQGSPLGSEILSVAGSAVIGVDDILDRIGHVTGAS